MSSLTTEPAYDYDVFVSYSHQDEAWVVNTLLPALESAGLKVCIDFRDFTPGRAALHNMRDAVKSSERTLLVMTPRWVNSEWSAYETILVRTSDPAGQRQRTIPLLLEACDIPEEIAFMTYVDFTRSDRQELAWRQLLTAFRVTPEPPRYESQTRDHWLLAQPYGALPHFTGRVAERATLTDWLENDTANRLFVLRALGGFGKSALTWHWLLHDVDVTRWSRVVWWSFYEGDSNFDNFVSKALAYLSKRRTRRGVASRDDVKTLVGELHLAGTLLVLDGFERVLRGYGGLDAAYRDEDDVTQDGNERDSISLIADDFLRTVVSLPDIRGKVMLTTRLRPAALEARGGLLLEGCREAELTQLTRFDAVQFFRAQGIRGTRAEIEKACDLYGYHALSLRLLAGLIVNDFSQPGDIGVAAQLDVSSDLVQRRHHVLQQAYASLNDRRQKLLSLIACLRGPASYDSLKVLQGAALPHSNAAQPATHDRSLDDDLRDLIARGLLQRDIITNRLGLHPIVRKYAYDRVLGQERISTHTRLRDYFATIPQPGKVASFSDLQPTIELYHHTARAGQYEEAWLLFRDHLSRPLYHQFGAYHLHNELLCALFVDGDERIPRLKDPAQGWVYNELARSTAATGQVNKALSLFGRAMRTAEVVDKRKNIARSLANIASQELATGSLRTAEGHLETSISLASTARDQFQEAIARRELGRLLAYRGAWDKSEFELMTAMSMFDQQGRSRSAVLAWACVALRELLRLRCTVVASKEGVFEWKNAIDAARRAVTLLEDIERTRDSFERDYVVAYWSLGSALRAGGELSQAGTYLQHALERCRRISLVESEAGILVDLASLRMGTGALDEAHRLAQDAQMTAERVGCILHAADAHIVLARLAAARGESDRVVKCAGEALRLARCDGAPDYTYKAAFDESTALFNG